MKKKVLFRVIGIGMFHAVLYMYIVPFLIYPEFGHDGFLFTVVVAVTISIAVFGTIILTKNKGDKNDE